LKFSFAVDDITTYTLLCYAGPLLLALQIENAKQLNAIPLEAFGPFWLSGN
jgi:hypothetical protein